METSKEIAVLIVAKELKLNETYRKKWQQGFATAMANALQEYNLPLTEEVIKAAYVAAGEFLRSVIAGAENPEHGWVYDFSK